MRKQIGLPILDSRARWSVQVVDATTEEALLEYKPDAQLDTASIGKIFLLVEVARRIDSGELDPALRVAAPEEYAVADSGILYRMRDREHCIEDLALLVGAFSDNLAANALLHHCGLEDVRAVASALGYLCTSLDDYIRDDRAPGMPRTPSYGTANELVDLMLRLIAGDVHSPAVSARVLDWLASNADTGLVADPLRLDPLAHIDADAQGIVLRHKTGSTSCVRADIGHVAGPHGAVVYAVMANWNDSAVDLRAPVTSAMRAIGEQIRTWVTVSADIGG